MKPYLIIFSTFLSINCFSQGYIEFNIQNGSCESCCDAYIDVSVAGCWAGAFTFKWTGPGGYTAVDEDISNLCPGEFTLDFVDELDQHHTTTIDLDGSGSYYSYTEDVFLECSGLGLPLCWIGYFPPDSIGGGGEACAFFPPCWSLPVDVEWRNSNDEVVSTLSCIESAPSGTYTVTLTSIDNETLTLEVPLLTGTADGTVSVDVCTETSTIENQNVEFLLSPNPAQSHLRVVTNTDNGPLKFSIYDLAGRKTYDGFLSSQSKIIPIQELSTGTYFIAVQNENGHILCTEKFIVE